MSLESEIEIHEDRTLLHAILAREYFGIISEKSYFNRKFGNEEWGEINPFDISFSDKSAEEFSKNLEVDVKQIKDAFSFLMNSAISESINTSGAFFLIPHQKVNMMNLQFESAYNKLGQAIENICESSEDMLPSFRSLDQNTAFGLMNSVNKNLSFIHSYGWILDNAEAEIISSIKEKYLGEAQRKFNNEIMKKYGFQGELKVPILNELHENKYETQRLHSVKICKKVDIPSFSGCNNLVAVPDDDVFFFREGDCDHTRSLSMALHTYGNGKVYAIHSKVNLREILRRNNLKKISEKYALIGEVKNILSEKHLDKQFKWDYETLKEEHLRLK